MLGKQYVPPTRSDNIASNSGELMERMTFQLDRIPPPTLALNTMVGMLTTSDGTARSAQCKDHITNERASPWQTASATIATFTCVFQHGPKKRRCRFDAPLYTMWHTHTHTMSEIVAKVQPKTTSANAARHLGKTRRCKRDDIRAGQRACATHHNRRYRKKLWKACGAKGIASGPHVTSDAGARHNVLNANHKRKNRPTPPLRR